MPITQYTYNVANDFPNGKVNIEHFIIEVEASSITTAISKVETLGGSLFKGVLTGGTFDIYFNDALSAAEKTTLDGDTNNPAGGLVGAHIAKKVTLKYNLASSTLPTVNDDNSQDYSIGSLWIVQSDRVFTCVDDSIGAAVWKEETPYRDIATGTSLITTTSTSDTIATNMTITPPAGTYAVWFTTSVSHGSTNNPTINVNIYSHTTKMASSERTHSTKSANDTTSVNCLAVATVNGSQAITGRWRTSTGTATMYDRSLVIFKV